MSRTKDHMMNLSGRPEFILGYDAYNAGKPRLNESGFKGEAAEAWFLGWDHAKWESDPDYSGDDESSEPGKP